jgi:ribosomal-protein-alanine N-acetyltransferase
VEDKMSLKNIHTDQLLLIPITFEITASLLDEKTEEIEKLGLHTDGSWPTRDTMDILPMLYEALKDDVPSGFETWLIVKKENNKIIGDIGFHGKPDEQGEVEIGYGLIEQEWGKGFGYQAVKAIVEWVISQESVSVLKAECLIDNKASARILEKVGMHEAKRENELVYWVLS